MNTATEVAKKLLQINAIKLSPTNPFTWASGLKSPIYCDNRIILSYPKIRNFIGDALLAKSKSFETFQSISGVATAGIAHGLLLADRAGLPFSYVRSKAKEHGRQNLIEGRIAEGDKVLVVEDLISTGGSSIKAVEALRAAGAEVVGVLAIFSYQFEKANIAFKAANCKFDTLSNYSVLLKTAIEDNYIPSETYEALTKWNEDPQTWSSKSTEN